MYDVLSISSIFDMRKTRDPLQKQYAGAIVQQAPEWLKERFAN